jgi:SSS family solute:Na+ symporter
MLSIMAPPIVAAFILGIFWKRANATGAFVGLLAGIAFGILNLVITIQTGSSMFGDIHFLLTVPFYLVWSMLVMVVVSLLTGKPLQEKVDNYTWKLSEFKKETLELKQGSFWSNYRVLSWLLIAFCFVVLILFW